MKYLRILHNLIHAAAAKIKTDLTKLADLLNTDDKTDKAFNINRMQYTRPDIDHLKQELDNVDVSTNIIYVQHCS